MSRQLSTTTSDASFIVWQCILGEVFPHVLSDSLGTLLVKEDVSETRKEAISMQEIALILLLLVILAIIVSKKENR